jgi:hypothetical protein
MMSDDSMIQAPKREEEIERIEAAPNRNKEQVKAEGNGSSED